jgi:hypothetical protein
MAQPPYQANDDDNPGQRDKDGSLSRMGLDRVHLELRFSGRSTRSKANPAQVRLRELISMSTE